MLTSINNNSRTPSKTKRCNIANNNVSMSTSKSDNSWQPTITNICKNTNRSNIKTNNPTGNNNININSTTTRD
jgi:hypothetical protein